MGRHANERSRPGSTLKTFSTREDGLIAEVWEYGTIRDRLELYRFLKPYASGVAKLPAESRPEAETFEGIMREISEKRRRDEALTTTAETIMVSEMVPAVVPVSAELERQRAAEDERQK